MKLFFKYIIHNLLKVSSYLYFFIAISFIAFKFFLEVNEDIEHLIFNYILLGFGLLLISFGILNLFNILNNLRKIIKYLISFIVSSVLLVMLFLFFSDIYYYTFYKDVDYSFEILKYLILYITFTSVIISYIYKQEIYNFFDINIQKQIIK